MHVLNVRNVHEAMARGIAHLITNGTRRDSRNGPVTLAPTPVATVYQRPWERVPFFQERDYNPFFNIYESLWMLSGRNDVTPLKRYVRDFDRYSDDGETLHGAYGHRWRFHFGIDQLRIIAARLRRDPDDRRSVLQMWDARADLNTDSRDVPCNDMATFQIGIDGKLHMTVFCRSNDVLWGAYYANAFHFSVLHEWMAGAVGVPQGTYTQVSVNYHAYVATLKPELVVAVMSYSTPDMNEVLPTTRMFSNPTINTSAEFLVEVERLLSVVDEEAFDFEHEFHEPFLQEAFFLLRLHYFYKHDMKSLALVQSNSMRVDTALKYSARMWMLRRLAKEA